MVNIRDFFQKHKKILLTNFGMVVCELGKKKNLSVGLCVNTIPSLEQDA